MSNFSFFLKKLLLNCFYPSCLIFFLLVIISVYVILGKRRGRRRFLLFLVIIVYYLSATPFFPYFMLKILEKPYLPPSEEQIKKTQYFILLTGGAYDAPSMSPEERLPRDALLRLLKSIELKKKFPKKELIIIGGNFKANSHKEASYYKEIAKKLGVSEKITVIENVYDTISSVKALKKLIPLNTPILLITSAYHLKRSLFLFKKEGFTQVIPYPANYNYKVCTPKFRIWDFFPDPLYLEMTTKAVHEYLGLIYYKIKYRS